jgi:molybdate transport system substrate-binding protein
VASRGEHYKGVPDRVLSLDFARAGVGVAVKAGVPKPDIGTPEAFKRAMLATKSIAYAPAPAASSRRG